jgi:hypothetical protein
VNRDATVAAFSGSKVERGTINKCCHDLLLPFLADKDLENKKAGPTSPARFL